MTVVASVEALTQLAEGEQIVVRSRQTGNRRWTSVADGFSRESVVVGAEFFTGYITEGRVTRVDDTPARAGEWWTAEGNRYDYFHMAIRPDGRLQSMTFHNGTFRSDNDYDLGQFNPETSRMRRLEQMPDRVMQNPESVRVILDRYADLLATTVNQLASAQERLSNKPEAEAEKAPTTESVRVTVVVSGQSRMPEAAARVALLLPRGATAEPPLVPWTFEFQYTAVVPVGHHACDDVDEERVAQRVPAGTETWDMEVSCSNHPTSTEATTAEVF